MFTHPRLCAQNLFPLFLRYVPFVYHTQAHTQHMCVRVPSSVLTCVVCERVRREYTPYCVGDIGVIICSVNSDVQSDKRERMMSTLIMDQWMEGSSERERKLAALCEPCWDAQVFCEVHQI